MSKTRIRQVAAAILRRPNGKVLLLKRSPTHSTNPNKWCFVTGFVEEGESPRDAAIRELAEELDIDSAPIRSGDIVKVKMSAELTLHVSPFLFDVEDMPVKLDWEHTAYAWVEPHEVVGYDTVEQLDEDLKSLGLL